MANPKISPLSYFRYLTFLKDFAESKRQSQPSWSLGSWAKKLGLSGTASISRVLNGERIPGEDLLEILESYFEFSPDEKKHFRKLVERERYYSSASIPGSPALVLRNAQLVTLVGVLDFEKVSRYLNPFDLEPLQINGHVLVAIHVNQYDSSTVGPFRESYAAMTVRLKNGGMLDSGLFFTGFVCDSKAAAEKFVSLGGHQPQHGEILFEREQGRVTTSIDGRKFQSLEIDLSSAKHFEERYEMNMYAVGVNGLFRSKFTIDSAGNEFPYREGHHFDLHANPFITRELKNLGFMPVKWVLHENLFSLIYTPTQQIRVGTY